MKNSKSISIVTALASLMLSSSAGAATWHVDDDAPGDPGPQNPLISNPSENGTELAPYDRIQEAINAAASGDIIQVAAGTYFEFGTVNLGNKNLQIIGASAAESIIDMINWTDQVMEIAGGQTNATEIRNLTIRNGRALAAAPNDRGAGIRCDGSSPKIIGCVFEDNQATIGAAFYANTGSQNLENCEFIGNLAANGGAMYINNATCTATDCVFSDNEATLVGGGLRIFGSTLSLTACTFDQNTAANDGGGIFLTNGSTATINNCVFTQNSATNSTATASRGGAFMHGTTSSATFLNCIFQGNHADNLGGAIYSSSALALKNCTFEANTADTSGAVFADTGGNNSHLTNCIVWNCGAIPVAGTGTPTADYSIIQGGMAGVGNLNIDPLFIDASLGDLRLQPNSPAIDAGNTPQVPLTLASDLDALPRVVNTLASSATGAHAFGYFVDIGAYEFQPDPVDPPSTCPADVSPPGGNNLVNVDDLLMIINAWGMCPK